MCFAQAALKDVDGCLRCNAYVFFGKIYAACCGLELSRILERVAEVAKISLRGFEPGVKLRRLRCVPCGVLRFL